MAPSFSCNYSFNYFLVDKMFNALKRYVGKVLAGRAFSLCPITELVGSQHCWNTPLLLGDQGRVGWACVGSKTVFWDSPSVPFKPCFKAAVCKRVFQPTLIPSIAPNLFLGLVGNLGWLGKCTATLADRRVITLVTEMGSAPINPICFPCHCQVWVISNPSLGSSG